MSSGGGAGGELLVVCGLGAEARIAAGAGVRCLAGGGDSNRLAHGIEAALAGGVRAVLSFGIAGALAPTLKPGSVLVATSVVDVDGQVYAVASGWADRLRERLPPEAVASGILCGSERIIASTAEKSSLHERRNAVAVDMESHLAARLAAQHGVPFAALRAIADPADRGLPPAALVGMRPGGGVALAAVLASLWRAPGQLPALLAVARDARLALGALERSRVALGRGFGDLDLDQLLLHVV